MKIITLPVTVDKKETLLGSVDTVYELSDNVLSVTMRYKYSCPKDEDDEYSAMEDRLVDYKCVILRTAIIGIDYIWNWQTENFRIEITTAGNSYSFSVSEKSVVVGLLGELQDWWLA